MVCESEIVNIIMWPWFIIRILNQSVLNAFFSPSVMELSECFIVIKFLFHSLKAFSTSLRSEETNGKVCVSAGWRTRPAEKYKCCLGETQWHLVNAFLLLLKVAVDIT